LVDTANKTPDDRDAKRILAAAQLAADPSTEPQSNPIPVTLWS
jgi:hypothetical protein